MGELLPLTQGPHQPELDSELWDSGSLRPSQPGLPRPTLDISLVLHDLPIDRDDGLAGAVEHAMKVRDVWEGKPRLLRWLSRRWSSHAARWISRRREVVTVVEAAVALPKGVRRGVEGFDLHLTSALDSAISLTRELTLTASVESHQPRLLPALELLPPQIPYLVGEYRGSRILKPWLGLISNAAHLSWSVEVTERAEPIGIPGIYESYQSLRNDAEVALLHHGQYRAATVLAAAAAEVLMTVLMKCVLLETGTDPAEAREILRSRTGVVAKAKRVLGPHLGGHWDERPGSAVARWVGALVTPRNAAVHGGQAVTRTEAQGACAALHELRRWVGGRVFTNRSKFPKTALALSIGAVMTPDGTQDTQLQWVENRLNEAGDDFAEFIQQIADWTAEEMSHTVVE